MVVAVLEDDAEPGGTGLFVSGEEILDEVEFLVDGFGGEELGGDIDFGREGKRRDERGVDGFQGGPVGVGFYTWGNLQSVSDSNIGGGLC